MRTRHVLTLTLVSALAVLGAACSKKAVDTTNQTMTNTSSTVNTSTVNTNSVTTGTFTTNTAVTNTAAASSAITINDMAFSPAPLTVKKGTVVTWTNNDSLAHTVTGSNGGPASGQLAAGKTYQFTFNTVGTFAYHCSNHPTMTGSVIVTE